MVDVVELASPERGAGGASAAASVDMPSRTSITISSLRAATAPAYESFAGRPLRVDPAIRLGVGTQMDGCTPYAALKACGQEPMVSP